MEISDLHISIDLFDNKEQLEKFLGLAGYSPAQREMIFEKYEGIIWSKTTAGQYALYLSVLNAFEKIFKSIF